MLDILLLLTLEMEESPCEGLKTFPIRLLHVWDSGGFVYLRIQNLKTGKVYEISRLLHADTGYCLWEIASLEYIMNLNYPTNSL